MKWKNFFIKLRSFFILNSAERKAYRQAQWTEHVQKTCDASRWGASYSIFDGEELLEASLNSIRGEVDYINVVYQLTSWYGRPANPGLADTLQALKAKGLIDELIEFAPDLSLEAAVNEINKRNLGLEHAKANGCDYFMTMDCDEMYFSEEMLAAKRFICENKITHSYCPLIAYGPEPTRLQLGFLGGGGSQFVSFFFKLEPDSKLTVNLSLPCHIDPTRRMAAHSPDDKHYVLHMVVMHHMSSVRHDLESKIANSSYCNGKRRIQMDAPPHVTVEDTFDIGVCLKKHPKDAES